MAGRNWRPTACRYPRSSKWSETTCSGWGLVDQTRVTTRNSCANHSPRFGGVFCSIGASHLPIDELLLDGSQSWQKSNFMFPLGNSRLLGCSWLQAYITFFSTYRSSSSRSLGSAPLSSMSNAVEIEVVDRNSTSMSGCEDIEAVSSEHEPLVHIKEEDAWDFAELKRKHTIFLSHSGAQKNFVEQLCEDLERAKQAPFFDKRPDSLPKGEKFAQLIFQAARQCQLAIVVISEEYFSRSKWPMLELATFVEAHKCTILPLFLGLSCKEFSDLQRRELWFARWAEWAQEDPRIQVDEWKHALKELDRTNGMEYSDAFGEVAYRKEAVATACTIVQKNLLLNEALPQWVLSSLKVLGSLALFFCIFILMAYVFFGIITPILDDFIEPLAQKNLEKMKSPWGRGIMSEPSRTCSINGHPIKCPGF